MEFKITIVQKQYQFTLELSYKSKEANLCQLKEDLSSSNLQILFICLIHNSSQMEDNTISKEPSNRNTKPKTVASLFLQNRKERSEKGEFIKHEARKTLFSESLFSQNEKQYPKGARKTSINDYQTKSLKEYELRGSTSKTALNRQRLENQDFKVQDPFNCYNENLYRLKVEEMTFKFKTKIGILLRQMSISVTELSKFTEFTKIDEILDFLADKVKEMMRLSQVRAATNQKGKNKDLETINDYEIQMQVFRKKIVQKQSAEKGYKERLKEAHHEIRELYDKINRRQKQISTKMTQLYQIRTIKIESDKLINNLTDKCFNLEKECGQLREAQINQNKKMHAAMKALEQENQELKEKMDQLFEINERQNQKETKILDINRHLNQQIQRWRQRFESQNIWSIPPPQRSQNLTSKEIITAQTIDIKEGSATEPTKWGQLTLLNQNSRLAFKVAELQRQNRDMSHELTLLGNVRTKYDQLRSCLGSADVSSGPSSVVSSSQNKNQLSKKCVIFELDFSFKRKIEENAKQWRQKLVEIVNTYEEEIESNKIQIKKLIKSEEELQAKIHDLANQKYQVESLLIEKEREIYELSRQNRDSCRVINSIEIIRPIQNQNPRWEQPVSNTKEICLSSQGPEQQQ